MSLSPTIGRTMLENEQGETEGVGVLQNKQVCLALLSCLQLLTNHGESGIQFIGF